MDTYITEWFVWIIIGALVGWLATIVVQSRQGLPTNMIIGIVGAFLGVYLFNQIAPSGVDGFNIATALVALISAIALLAVARLFVGRYRATY